MAKAKEVKIKREELVAAVEDINKLMAEPLDTSLDDKELEAALKADASALHKDDDLSEGTWAALAKLEVGPRYKLAAEATKGKKGKAKPKAAAKPKKEAKGMAPAKGKKDKTATKPKKEAKPKKEKAPRYTRDMAVVDALKAFGKKAFTLKDLMAASDALFVKKTGGSSNPNATNVNRYIVLGLVGFGVLVVDGDNYKLA